MSSEGCRYKYLDVLTTTFVVILLLSNLVAQKICMIGRWAVSGAVLLFPVTYIFGDVFTEVYGFAASRRAIWLGTFGTALLYAMGVVLISLLGRAGLEKPAGVSDRLQLSAADPNSIADRLLAG